MDFYNCPYVDVIPFRNGNEYDEAYRCAATEKSCQGCQCKLTPEKCERLIQKQINLELEDESVIDKREVKSISRGDMP